MGLTGATVLVTGGSSGIGAATARTLAAAGARVLVAGRNAARLRAVAAETGGLALEADLAAPDGPAELARAALHAAATWHDGEFGNQPVADAAAALAARDGRQTRNGRRPVSSDDPAVPGGLRVAAPARAAVTGSRGTGTGHVPGPGPAGGYGDGPADALASDPVPVPDLSAGEVPALGRAGQGGIDILINNAGIGWAGPLTEMSAAKVAQLVAVNLTAPIELTRLLAPALAAGGRGRVVFVSSIAGATGVPQEAVYSATKAGLNYFAESLRYELAGSGVGVSVVVPGVIDTPFFAIRGKPYARKRPAPISAQRAARSVLTAIEREQPVAFVPRWLRFPAWLHSTAPGAFRALAARFG